MQNPLHPPEIPEKMRAMLLDAPHTPLRLAKIETPRPGPGQVLLEVRACGVCHTDLHIVDGELDRPKLPLVLGHQIIGRVVGSGPRLGRRPAQAPGGAKHSRGQQPRSVVEGRFQFGQRVGVPWLGRADGDCIYCRRGRENLCQHPRFTGYDCDGGFAEYAVADERFCFPIPDSYSDAEAAPLLCAGLIGYRTYRMAGENVEALGLYGFGAAAHIVAQVAKHNRQRVYAFTRPGDAAAQAFALRQGADWAGDSTVAPPEPLDAALIFAPVGALIPEALKRVRPGGVVVCGGIHMSDIPSFPYGLLWEERVVRSVANLTRQDGEEFLRIAPQVPVRTEVSVFPLEEAGEALDRLRAGKLTGAAVLEVR